MTNVVKGEFEAIPLVSELMVLQQEHHEKATWAVFGQSQISATQNG